MNRSELAAEIGNIVYGSQNQVKDLCDWIENDRKSLAISVDLEKLAKSIQKERLLDKSRKITRSWGLTRKQSEQLAQSLSDRASEWLVMRRIDNVK